MLGWGGPHAHTGMFLHCLFSNDLYQVRLGLLATVSVNPDRLTGRPPSHCVAVHRVLPVVPHTLPTAAQHYKVANDFGCSKNGSCRAGLVCAPFDSLCDIPSGCCSFTGPWTVTRSSLRMLRRVAAFCRPLRPVLLLVSFPRSRSPVFGVLGLC